MPRVTAKTGGRGLAARLLALVLALAVLAPTGLGLSLGASAALAQTPMEDQYGGPGVGYAAGAEEPLASAEQLGRLAELAGTLGGEGGVAALEERLGRPLEGLTASEAAALLGEMESAAGGGGTLEDALAGYEAAGGAPGEAPGGGTAGDETAVGEAPGGDGAGVAPAGPRQPAGEGEAAAEGQGAGGPGEDPASWEERRAVRAAANGAVDRAGAAARNPHAPGVVAGAKPAQPEKPYYVNGKLTPSHHYDPENPASRKYFETERVTVPDGGYIEYGALDKDGNPTGTRSRMTQDVASSTGTKPRGTIRPPGFEEYGPNTDPDTGKPVGNQDARWHLHGCASGGCGKDPRNLIAGKQDPGNSPIMSNIEKRSRDYVLDNPGKELTQYDVTPVMDEGEGPRRPLGVRMTVTGPEDFDLNTRVDGVDAIEKPVETLDKDVTLEDGRELKAGSKRYTMYIPVDPEEHSSRVGLPGQPPDVATPNVDANGARPASGLVYSISDAVPASVLKPAGRVAGAVGGPVGDVVAVGAAMMMGEDPGDAAGRGAAGAAGGAVLGAAGMAACGPPCAFLAGAAGSAAGEAAYDAGKKAVEEYGDGVVGAAGGGVRKVGDLLGF